LAAASILIYKGDRRPQLSYCAFVGKKKGNKHPLCMGLGIAQVWGEEARLPEHLFGPPGVKQNQEMK
jgi:hypothetical protein